MTYKNLWVWCEDCLEWKDADDLLMAKEIDEYGKDLFTFACDACKRDTKGSVVVSARAKPKKGVVTGFDGQDA